MTTGGPLDVHSQKLEADEEDDGAAEVAVDPNDELIAALEYWLGLNADVYAISDVLEITAAAVQRRLRATQARAEETRDQGGAGDPCLNGQDAKPSANDDPAIWAGTQGRRYLDDALLLLFLRLYRDRHGLGPFGPEEG